MSFYSWINPWELIKSQFHDKIRINTLNPISKNNIISINYDVEFLFDVSDKKKFISTFDIVEINKVDGPIFNNDDDEEKKKNVKNNPENQSFFSKYWWIIMIMMFMLMMNGGDEQGEAKGENK